MADLKTTTDLAVKVTQILSAVQVRAEVGKAIAVVSGMQEVLKVYGTEMEYETNKELFDNIIQAANVALRTSQASLAKQALTRDEAGRQSLPNDAAGKEMGAKVNNVIVGITGKQDFTSVEIDGDDNMNEFCADLVKALNGCYKKSLLVAGEKLGELSK